MERSSPLAAMRPPAAPGPWSNCSIGPDLLGPNTRLAGHNGLGQNSFNFKDLSMKKSSSNYFSLGPMRGSSPTASLAADLSQNFHIDQSPQLPTPRRSLFTSSLFGSINGRENVVTPPLPSSSPGLPNDSMDISPLPHKAPFSRTTQISVDPPTPNIRSDDSMILSSPINHAGPQITVQETDTLPEIKVAPIRPMLHRMKGYSTNCVLSKDTKAALRPPPFRFGTNPLPQSNCTSLSLGECFADSPPQERKPPTSAAMPVSHSRPPLFRLNTNGRIGSNASPFVKKPPPSQCRPRKQFRRSLSMFEHPAEMHKTPKKPLGEDNNLQSIMDVDECYQLKVPHFFPSDRADNLPRISRDTFVDVLDGKYDRAFSKVLIVDCRFEYEYQGGHVLGAANYNDKEDLSSHLFGKDMQENTLLILHCEYSVHRAPIMARFVREQDRNVNMAQYPKLSYPDLYILDGGYSAFFTSQRMRCYPQNYVEMDAKEHARTCEREMGKIRNNRGKLHRARTFAFGVHQIDSSPTGQRNSGDNIMLGCASNDDSVDPTRLHARRMASY